jgi:hypothetical protein
MKSLPTHYKKRVGGSNLSSLTTQKPVTFVTGYIFCGRSKLVWIMISKIKIIALHWRCSAGFWVLLKIR